MSQFGTLWDSHDPSRALTGILGPVGAPTAGSKSLQQSAPHGLEPHHRTMARLLWREAQASRPITALQTPTEFYRTFEAERVRTERTGSVFAVVTVNLAPEDRGGLQKCVETTQGLVRIYDTVGSLGSASVAVLLPETDPDGARSFADRLFTGLGNAGVRADLDVYSYPIDWEDEEEPSEARPETHAPLPRTGSHGLFALCEGTTRTAISSRSSPRSCPSPRRRRRRLGNRPGRRSRHDPPDRQPRDPDRLAQGRHLLQAAARRDRRPSLQLLEVPLDAPWIGSGA